MQAKPKDWPESRAQQNPDQPLPPLPEETRHIEAAFRALGFAVSNGFGMAPLPFTEIVAGAPWADEKERHLLREMSREYLAGYRLGEDAFGVPPWRP